MLYTLGRNHGTHSFVVQLRDMETHEPMPGWMIENFYLLSLNNET